MGLVDKLNALKRDDAISMHVPGHKNMTIGNLDKLEWSYDKTEITGLDDLHSPDGVLLELNDLLSEKQPGYNAQAVVNGTTTGVLSAVHALKGEVDKFLIVGDAHKSVYHALDLAGVTFEKVAVNDLFGMSVDNTAVLITYPSYSGHAPALDEAIERVKVAGDRIVVDEAHGAHFGITGRFPRSALSHGADIVIQSYHKMLPALTGASVVFTKEEAIHKRVMKYIDHFETSSPSYLILASIELAHQFYNDFEDEVFFKKRSELIKNLEHRGFSVTRADDPAKIVLNIEGVSPYLLFDALNRKGVYSEMVTEEGVLWCLPLFHEGDSYPLESLSGRLDELNLVEDVGNEGQEDLNFLLGRPAVRAVVPYPPGVPLIHEGERFTEEVIKSIIHKKSYHVKIEGIEENIAYYKVDDA
ncbi:hypothetical protein [Salinicoccus halitifaciens]|uniref:Arginine/lysine/ornithine decarboxylase n=1 Tax=Salinicoccus halitifaciens TaxID=1073415 RepID=A0ABV2EAR5_9STAP|nr:hypothetical protein [Salinicoccus halitifaciens]MCD2138351.1 hypothetical protein [Salinicoccus halitifaciens]